MRRYTTRCARMCWPDSKQAPPPGDQWVHVGGQTLWVCRSCAEKLGRQYGIPSRSDIRRETRRREARMQLSLLAEDPQRTSRLS